jgi:hypothetical protein
MKPGDVVTPGPHVAFMLSQRIGPTTWNGNPIIYTMTSGAIGIVICIVMYEDKITTERPEALILTNGIIGWHPVVGLVNAS